MRWKSVGGFLFACIVIALNGELFAQTYLKEIPRNTLTAEQVKSPPPENQFFIDIQAPANHRLDQNFNDPIFAGDDLSELLVGEFKTESGIRYNVGKQIIALQGKLAPQRPEKIRIKVGQKASSLYFLHGCGWGAFGGPGSDHFEKDGTLIGYYRVNYEDDDYEVIPIVYGKDVRDWWGIWDKFAPTRNSEIVWRGSNKHLKGRREARDEPKPLRLFQKTWVNPWPTLNIVSIDFVSTGGTAAPFCVAISGFLEPEKK